MAADDKWKRHKFLEISNVASEWLERNPYIVAFEQQITAEILQGNRLFSKDCEKGFEIRLRKLRRGVPFRIITCIEEDDFTYFVRWIHDVPI